MGEFFGELERIAADLYPYRWYIIAAVVVGVAAIGVYGYRGGWHRWAWRHRLPVAAVGTPVVVVAAFAGYTLLSPLFTNVTVDEELPFALAIPDNTEGSGDAPPTPEDAGPTAVVAPSTAPTAPTSPPAPADTTPESNAAAAPTPLSSTEPWRDSGAGADGDSGACRCRCVHAHDSSATSRCGSAHVRPRCKLHGDSRAAANGVSDPNRCGIP